jgi:hypothetical protein
MNECEITNCGNEAVARASGVHVCERCCREYSSVGWYIAVRFGGCWNGVRGVLYTPEQVDAFPGLALRDIAQYGRPGDR